jgi:hypothetical protein
MSEFNTTNIRSGFESEAKVFDILRELNWEKLVYSYRFPNTLNGAVVNELDILCTIRQGNLTLVLSVAVKKSKDGWLLFAGSDDMSKYEDVRYITSSNLDITKLKVWLTAVPFVNFGAPVVAKNVGQKDEYLTDEIGARSNPFNDAAINAAGAARYFSNDGRSYVLAGRTENSFLVLPIVVFAGDIRRLKMPMSGNQDVNVDNSTGIFIRNMHFVSQIFAAGNPLEGGGDCVYPVMYVHIDHLKSFIEQVLSNF